MIFFALLSALRRSRPALVIRSFITLPARHSAVAANAISPDSHNYPRIERGKGERRKKFSKQNCGSDRVYMGKKCMFERPQEEKVLHIFEFDFSPILPPPK